MILLIVYILVIWSRGDYVGLCFERSAEVVIAIVAVLKLGMVYVSIDSSLPKQEWNLWLRIRR